MKSLVAGLSLWALAGSGTFLSAQAPRIMLVDSLARAVAVGVSEDLRKGVAQADMDGEAARLSVDLGREGLRRAQSLYDVQKLEIDALNKKIDLADKEKREADKKALELTKKDLERRLRVLDRWRDVHEAAVRAGEARRDAAVERKKLIEAELELADLRETRNRTAADSAGAADRLSPAEDVLLRQTRRVIEARKNEADRRHQVGERERDLADKLAALVEAQVALRLPRN